MTTAPRTPTTRIEQLTLERDALLRELATAQNVEKRRIQGLLRSTERGLRWQRSRAGMTSTPDPEQSRAE